MNDKINSDKYSTRLRNKTLLKSVKKEDFVYYNDDDPLNFRDKGKNENSNHLKESKCNLLKLNLKSNCKENIQCEICNKIRKSKKGYESHKQRHFTESLFQCNICHVIFTKQSSLSYHVRTKHIRKSRKREKCPICDKFVFLINSHIVKHGLKAFVCEYCNKEFLQYSIYVNHISTHNDIRSFQCYVCDVRFNRKWNLDIHLKKHEKIKQINGVYLPMKVRGKPHENVKINLLESQSSVKNNVEQLSVSCDTADLQSSCEDCLLSRDEMTTGNNFSNSTYRFNDELKILTNTKLNNPANEQLNNLANEQLNNPANEQLNNPANEQLNNLTNENMADSTNRSLLNSLFNSRSCDTSDMNYFMELLRGIPD